MVRYFETEKQSITVRVMKNRVVLSADQQKEVKSMWEQIQKSNPSAFNGGVWTCRDYSDSGIIIAAMTDYATATWGRRTNKPIRTMGTGILVFEGDNVILARRSNKVVSDPGKISLAAGGVLDLKTPRTGRSFLEMVDAQMEKEFDEELKAKKQTGVGLIGLAIGPGFKAEWCGVMDVNGPKIKDRDEAVELIGVNRRNLPEFVEKNRNSLEL